MTSNELNHHGILGMKWGVRRYQNPDGTRTAAGKKRYAENYSATQRQRDEAVYSKGAVKRINKRMLNGEGVQTARSREADRIESFRNGAQVTRKVLKTAGMVGVAAATAYAFSKFQSITEGDSNAIKSVAITAGAALVGETLLPKLGSAAVMRAGGYKASKFRR